MKKQNVMFKHNLSRLGEMKMSRFKKFFRICSFMLFFSMILFATHSYPTVNAAVQQQITITGTVSDVSGDPLPGVTVMIKGISQGTATDANGAYTLPVQNENAILVFSYIGYISQEVAVGNRRTVNITLNEDILQIEEVVVVGYGITKRKDLTGSITTLNAQDLNMGAYVNVMQAVQGKVPGLSISKDGDPNGGASILLRGASTLRTGSAQEPLYVIDGVPGGMLSSMDDIVSIDVLRDASATAIYGARAANGVIMITTKRGEENTSKISYSAYLGVEKISNRIEMMTASEYRAYLSANDQSLQPEAEDHVDRDWQDELTRVGISHNNYLSVSGGSSKTTYFASVAYKSIDGIIRETGRNTMSFMANVQQKAIKDRLRVGLTVNTAVTKGQDFPHDNGDPQPFLFAMLAYRPTLVDTNPDGTPKELFDVGTPNPNNLLDQNKKTFDSKSILLTGNVQFEILKGWDVNANASYRYGQSNNNEYYGKDSRWARTLNGVAMRNTSLSEMKVIESFTSYTQKFNEHDVKLMLGYSWQEEVGGDGFQTVNNNFVSDAISYYNLALGSGFGEGIQNRYGGYAVSPLRLISGYLRFNYAYKDRYLLQATVRRDGSSAFGPNNRWGYFPSFSAGWRITEESFMDNQRLFDNLKLRAGYGVSGNSLGFDPLLWRSRYSSSASDPMFYYQGEYLIPIKITQNENPDLKWESTSMLNLGLDFAILNGRISGTVEWYDKKTKDLIWSYPVPASQYYVNSLTANVGAMENKGWEVTLNVIPVKKQDFVWNSSFNISMNKNNVTSISSDEFKLDYIRWATSNIGSNGQTGNYAQIILEGYPIGQFYLWEYAGRNAEGLSQFYDKDGNLTTTPSSEDHHIQEGKTAQPKAIYGWHNSITWKRFNLDFLFRGVTGNYVLNCTRGDLNWPSGATLRNMHKMTATEPINDFNAAFISSRYLEKGDYIRLDNITLSYQFKMNNEYVKSLRVYGTVNNAFVFTKYEGLDPEVTLGGSTPGIDNRNYYPQTRTFMLGVNVEF